MSNGQTTASNAPESRPDDGTKVTWASGCLSLALAPWILVGTYLLGSFIAGPYGGVASATLGALFLIGLAGGGISQDQPDGRET